MQHSGAGVARSVESTASVESMLRHVFDSLGLPHLYCVSVPCSALLNDLASQYLRQPHRPVLLLMVVLSISTCAVASGSFSRCVLLRRTVIPSAALTLTASLLLFRKLAHPDQVEPPGYTARLQQWRRHACRVSARPSSCAPDGMVIVSMTNAHSARWTVLQLCHAPSCIISRFALYCGGSVPEPLSQLCFPGATIRPSDTWEADYEYSIWLKWYLLHEALACAKRAFFFDADVMWLGNPLDGVHLPASDLAYQAEGGPNGGLNGGQLLLSSRSLGRAILALPKPSHNLDQLVVQGWLSSSAAHNFTHAMLPLAFRGYCACKPTAENTSAVGAPPWCWPARHKCHGAYHAHCLSSSAAKLEVLARVSAQCGLMSNLSTCRTVVQRTIGRAAQGPRRVRRDVANAI